MSNTSRHHSRVSPTLLSSIRTTSIRSTSSQSQQQQPKPKQKHALFKAWNVKDNYIEANGDYTQDAWLESHIGGPLYQHQDSLPKLPVPTISDTLQRFLPTALPLCQSDEERETLQAAVDQFPQQAAPLQEALLQRAYVWNKSSWLQHWWNTLGYLQIRDSVVINVSYFFDFCQDVSTGTTLTNVQRGAALLTAVAQFRQDVASGRLPCEHVGKKTSKADNRKPLCSTAYKYLFHACRIPRKVEDTCRVYDPSTVHHVIVARHGHFFAMEFCHPITGQAYPLSILEQGLTNVLEQAEALEKGSAGALPKLGWLTSQNRDVWAQGRQALLEFGGEAMERALTKLQSGAVLLCLDDEAPVSRQESAQLYLHGNLYNNDNERLSSSSSSGHDHHHHHHGGSGHNRWFDKSIQLVVCQNAKAGLVGEHCMMDGMPVVNFANRLMKMNYAHCRQQQQQQSQQQQEQQMAVSVQPIFGPELYPALQQARELVDAAQTWYYDWTSRHTLHVQTFHGYGSSFMKQAGFSPDAFVQMAMQIATYRLWHGQQAGTYESTQVRPFLHGRTETTRSVSIESATLCRAMGLQPYWNEPQQQQEKSQGNAASAVITNKVNLLRQAAQAHVKTISLASQAQGVDRHFLGLTMIAAESAGNNNNNATLPKPDLLSHPVYVRSKTWRVSTSHLTHPQFENWGYGEVVPDGVGLSYSIHPRHVVFNVTALRRHVWTDKLVELLQESLLELRRLIETTEQQATTTTASGTTTPLKSKL